MTLRQSVVSKLCAVVCLSAGLLAAACGGSNNGPSGPSTPEPAFGQQDLVVGTGTEATNGRQLTVHYTLWLYNASAPDQKGQLVQSSVGSTPYVFVLGTRSVIPGWEQGVPGMKVGGVRRLIIPSTLAYGSQAQNGIPANSTLVFEIQLLNVA